jgi:hypothetical protein
LEGRASPDLAFDLHADGDADTADDTPWIQKLDPNRFAERVAAYPKLAAVTASGDALPPPPDQPDGKPAWEKYRYQ